MKIITVLGARPQFIKAIVVSTAIAASNELKEIIAHTWHHFDANMSDVLVAELGMEKPAYHLDIHGGGHGEMTGRMLIKLKVLLDERTNAASAFHRCARVLVRQGKRSCPTCR